MTDTRTRPIVAATARLRLAGPLPPAAVATLGARAAALIDVTAFSPDGIVVDADGDVSIVPAVLGRRFVPPEGTTNTGPAAMWALGRALLELHLGRGATARDLADAATACSDPRLGRVLAALLERDPACRLQGPRAAERACAEAAVAIGGGDGELAAAARRHARATSKGRARATAIMKATLALPAAAILGAEELARLRTTTSPSRPVPRAPRALPPTVPIFAPAFAPYVPPEREVRVRVIEPDDDIAASVAQEARRRALAVSAGLAVIVAVGAAC